MENCFAEIIGYKDNCSTVEPSSGLYIEDIGITSKECDFYINSEYRNGGEFIADKIDFATTLVRKTIANHFSDYINTKSLLSSKMLGNYQDSLSLKSGAINTLGGMSLLLNNANSYFNIYVNSISLQLSTTQSVNVFVYNLVTGELLDTIAISCVANKISTSYVNKTYSSNKRKLDLIFVYDTEGLYSNTCQLDYSGCSYCNGYTYSNNYVSVQPVYMTESDSKIRSSLTSTSHTYGLSLNYSIQCSLDNWLCDISNLMALPILYKTGIEIMQYALYYSKRQTSGVNIDAERNKERLAMYQTAYSEALEATIKKINIPQYDVCFKCDEYLRSAIILP